jgi:glyoxylase-like metal-dependent hydrolase (beta-lactamase superfamily II)
MKKVFLILTAFLIIGCSTLTIKPTETGQIANTNIYAIKNSMAAVFLIKTENGYIMFDTGMNLKKLEKSFKKAVIDPNDVKWVFLTHSDYDHVAGLPLFLNAKIYMNEDELPLINGTVKRNKSSGNTLPKEIDINKIILLSNDQELLLGGIKIECIKTPGHTIGSMSYLVDGKELFTGDAFRISKGEIIVHPYTMDEELAEKTIEQLKEKINNSSIVLTCHYGSIVN